MSPLGEIEARRAVWYAYIQSNMVGFLKAPALCVVRSVYGLNSKVPYSEDDKVDNPVSLYAASKKSKKFSPT